MSGPPVGNPDDDEPTTQDAIDTGSEHRSDGSRSTDPPSESNPSARDEEMASGAADSRQSTESRDRSENPVRWFLRTDRESVVLVRDILSSIALVAIIGLILFAVSGVWPPLVAVESGSMEPNMERGDLIIIVDEARFSGDNPVHETGIVTHETGVHTGHERFGKPGDVIIFSPNGDATQTPVIHRAHFWVEEGENWVDSRANQDYVGNSQCAEIDTCPARHDGFITKGDDNSGYDQLSGSGTTTDVVKTEWVSAKGMVRIPWLGHVRLAFDSVLSTTTEQKGAHDEFVPDESVLPSTPPLFQLELITMISAMAIVHSHRSGHW